MKYQENVVLVSDEPLTYTKLVEVDNLLKERNIKLGLIDIEFHCLERCQEILKQKGTTYISSLSKLEEAVIPKTNVHNQHALHLLIKVLRDKLQSLSPVNNLIIVDNFLFPKKLESRQKYVQTFEDIFGSVSNNIKEFKFITKPSYDSSLYNEVKQLLIGFNSQLIVTHKTTEDFHDRFWIADESKGLFIGTSLNGIGKRYALVDNIRDEDTKEIVQELKKLSLI